MANMVETYQNNQPVGGQAFDTAVQARTFMAGYREALIRAGVAYNHRIVAGKHEISHLDANSNVIKAVLSIQGGRPTNGQTMSMMVSYSEE